MVASLPVHTHVHKLPTMEGKQAVPLEDYFLQLSHALTAHLNNGEGKCSSPSEGMEMCGTSSLKSDSEDERANPVESAEIAASKGLLGLGGGDKMAADTPSVTPDPSPSSSLPLLAPRPFDPYLPFVLPPLCFHKAPPLYRVQQAARSKKWYLKKKTVKQNSLVVWYARVMTQPSHLLHIPEGFDPSQEFYIESTSGAKLAHYLPKAFLVKDAQEAYEATTELEKVVNPQWRHNTRTAAGKAIQLHFGQWRRSTKVEKTQDHTGDTKDHLSAVQRWAQRLQPGIFTTVKKLLRAKVPHFSKFLEALSTQQAWSFGGFSVCSINFNYGGLREHTDEKDHHDAYCVVVPLGNFQGGELCFRFAENVVVIPVQQGDAVIMQGANITHFVQEYSGNRYSLVLHTCYCLVRDMVPSVAVAGAYQC
jgi:hypothetical protein